MQRLIDLGQPIVRLQAQHTTETKLAQALQVTPENAWGLETKLYLAHGARVRLTVNLATEAGLVNGAMGHVRDVVWSGDVPQFVLVEFDTYTGPPFFDCDPSDFNNPLRRSVPITVFPADLDKGRGQRIQFPLRLAWALTIHKSQGMTLKKATVSIGNSEGNAPGRTFVAISRLTDINGLVLQEGFNLDRLKKLSNSGAFKSRSHVLIIHDVSSSLIASA